MKLRESVPVSAASLDAQSPVPLYHQLFLHFSGAIQAGAIRAGDYLPAERDIAERFGVARITATRAVKELARAGLVSRERGRGTRVNFIAEAVVRRGPRGDGATTAGKGTGYDAVIHAFEYAVASPEVAEALAVPEVQRSVRILSFAGRPYAHLTASVPAALGRRWAREDLAVAPLGVLIEAAGTTIVRSEEQVTARLADPEFAALLDVAPGAALLEVVRLSFDPADVAVEHIRCRYVPERYTYTVASSQG